MLTDAQCRNATCPPDKKRARLTDAGGLYLEISPAGSKRWFWKFRDSGKEFRLALGSYPAVSLTAARQARDTAKLKRAKGIDPIQERKLSRLVSAVSVEESFGGIAEEWFKRQKGEWSESHTKRVRSQLDRDLLPDLGERRLSDIKAPELLAVLRQIEARGAIETAHRNLTLAGQVIRFAIACGKAETDITPLLRGALLPVNGGHHPAITDPEELAVLLRAIHAYRPMVVKTALLLSALCFQRPGELRKAKWQEFDLEGGMWTIPSQRMKRRKHGKEHGEDHFVPLSAQAVDLLTQLKPFTHYGQESYVFPAVKDRNTPISEAAMNEALKSLGYQGRQTAHGFRATARTLLVEDESLLFDPSIVEAQLAHTVPDALGRAYNRTQFKTQRIRMMQAWGDYLSELASPRKIIPLHQRKSA